MTLPIDKLSELKLMLDMTYEGDLVGLSLLSELLVELAQLGQSEEEKKELLDLAGASNDPNYLARLHELLEQKLPLCEDSSTKNYEYSITSDPSSPLPEALLNELRLIVDMTHEGDAVGNTLIAEQFRELLSFAQGHPAEPLIAELAKSPDAPNYLEVVQYFLENCVEAGCQIADSEAQPASDLVENNQGNSILHSLPSQFIDDPITKSALILIENQSEVEAQDLGDIAAEYKVEGDLEILQEFCTECEEHLTAIEQVILASGGQYKKDAIDTIFRGIHSIKGGSAYFNLQEMTKCSHLLEDMLHEVREGQRLMDPRLEQLCLFYLDCQKDALKRYRAASASGLAVRRANDSLKLLERIRLFDTESEISSDTAAEPSQHEKNGIGISEHSVDRFKDEPSKQLYSEFGPEQGCEITEQNRQKNLAQTFASGPSSEFYESNRFEKKSDGAITKKMAGESLDSGKKFVKVATERLDNLIDLIGEMVVFSSVLVRHSKLHMSDQKEAIDAAQRVEKFSRELQDVGISMRLDPIRGLFQKMQRLVWDTSKRLEKIIYFQMEGEETELDRNLIDRLADPLMHMVRNSLDHGIESAEEREKKGKTREGTIKLSAYHSGGNVHIKIEDDGRGLNPAQLIAKATEKGLIEEGKRLTDEEAFQLIFSPGFSTANQVTDLSGRGVGMDVVRRNVEELRGRIHITSSVGKGSSFVIELPLTLAIIDGIQITVGSESFIIPSLSIVEFVRPRAEMIHRAMDTAESFLFRGKSLPLFRLSDIYNIKGAIEDLGRASIVILEDNGDQFGFLVDSIEGECSTVIKNLGGVFEDVRGISGGAIMPQGNVVLILDVKSMIRFAQDSYAHIPRPSSNRFNHGSLAILH